MTSADRTDRTTLQLLDDWHAGDKEALLQLVGRHAPWIRTYASKRMTDRMRVFETSEDVVQTVLMNLLKYTPPFRPQDDVQFRALIARVVLNRLSDLNDRTNRGPAVERLPSTVSRIGIGIRSAERPERGLEEEERARERGFVALALQLVSPEDRRVVHLHDFERKTFAEIGALLGIKEDTARFRYNRALERLRKMVVQLKLGELEELTKELGEGSDGGGGD